MISSRCTGTRLRKDQEDTNQTRASRPRQRAPTCIHVQQKHQRPPQEQGQRAWCSNEEAYERHQEVVCWCQEGLRLVQKEMS